MTRISQDFIQISTPVQTTVWLNCAFEKAMCSPSNKNVDTHFAAERLRLRFVPRMPRIGSSTYTCKRAHCVFPSQNSDCTMRPRMPATAAQFKNVIRTTKSDGKNTDVLLCAMECSKMHRSRLQRVIQCRRLPMSRVCILGLSF